MCIVIRQEIDQASVTPSIVPAITIPEKINTLEIGPITEIPTAGQAVGLTQPEINALTNLVRDWPKATTDNAKNNLLIQNCMVLGKSGLYVPVNEPPHLTMDIRLPWDHYMTLGFPERLGYWYRAMQQHTNVHDKIRSLVSLLFSIQ